MARIGTQRLPLNELKGNITNIDFLENMFKPMWKGSLTDLDGFINKLILDAFNNPNNFGLQYNISDNRLNDIKALVNIDHKSYIEEVIKTNNMIELRALLSIVIQETYFKYENKELESYPFADRALFDAFEGKQGNMKGNGAKVGDLAFEKIQITTNTLTPEQRTKLLEIIQDKLKFQSMFSAIKLDGKNIEVLYSRHGILEYTKGFAQSKSTFSYSTEYKDSSASNQRSIKFFETLAKEYDDLVIDLRYGESKKSNTISSNEILLKNDEHIKNVLDEELAIDEKLKGIVKSEKSEFRGSKEPSSNISMIIEKNTNNDEEIKSIPLDEFVSNDKKEVIEVSKQESKIEESKVETKVQPKIDEVKEVKVEKDLTKVVNVEKSTVDEFKNDILKLEIEKQMKKIKEAEALTDRLSMDFLVYLDQGKSIEDINKLLLESSRNNTFAVDMAKALALRTLTEIKSKNEELVIQNNEYSNSLIEANENIVKAIEVIKNKDVEINGLNQSMDIQKNSYEKTIGENLETIKTITNEYNDAVEKGNELFDKLNIANETIVSKDKIINTKNEEMVLFTAKFVRETQLKDKEINELKTLLANKDNLISKLETNNKSLESTIKENNSTIANLNNQVVIKDNSIKTLNNELTNKTNEIKMLNKTIETNNSNYIANIDKLNSNINELNTIVNNSKSTIKGLETEVSNKDNSIKTLNNEINELKGFNIKLAAKEKELLETNNRLEYELKKLISKTNVVENKIEIPKVETKVQQKIEETKVQPKVEQKPIQSSFDMKKAIEEEAKLLDIDENKSKFNLKEKFNEEENLLNKKDEDSNSKNHKQ